MSARRHPSFRFLLSAAVLFPVLTLNAQPVVTSGVIAPDTEWETLWYLADSKVPGPSFMLVGGIHGDEPAGAFAADQIRHWPVTRGKLLVIPRANRKALEAKNRRLPGLEGEDGDVNRHFPASGAAGGTRSLLAGAIWDLVKETKPDWIIDLHEGSEIHRINPESVGSTLIYLADKKTEPFFEHALAAVNASIEDPQKLFLPLTRTGGSNGSLVSAAREHLGATTAIFETTHSAWPLGIRIRQHRLMVHRLLKDLGMIAGEPDDLIFKIGNDSRIAVAIFVGPGVGGAGPLSIDETLDASPDRFISRIIGPGEVQNGTLDQFDVVIFPGGSGSRQAAGIGEKGRARVREFVSKGGGYVGICAGCYLACENFSWSLKILDARTKSSKWKRGVKELELGFIGNSLELLSLESPSAPVQYANGPVMEPAGSPDLADYTTLAVFKTEVAENGTPKGIQIDSPAILTGTFGGGRVVGISPHPEQSGGLEAIVPRLIEWSVGDDPGR